MIEVIVASVTFLVCIWQVKMTEWRLFPVGKAVSGGGGGAGSSLTQLKVAKLGWKLSSFLCFQCCPPWEIFVDVAIIGILRLEK